jgi:hypothetical protein
MADSSKALISMLKSSSDQIMYPFRGDRKKFLGVKTPDPAPGCPVFGFQGGEG